MSKGGVLEVVLVGAHRIKHVNHIGTPVYQAILECGHKVYHSKNSAGKHGEVLWNQKFKFVFPADDWRHLMHLKIRIMNCRKLRASKFVGQTIVHIGGIVQEGMARGALEVKPTVYNVVLEDDSYRGEIKLGMRFIANAVQPEEDKVTKEPPSPTDSTKNSRQLWLFIRKLVFGILPKKALIKMKIYKAMS